MLICLLLICATGCENLKSISRGDALLQDCHYDIVEGEDLFALYFKDPIVSRAYIGDEWLVPFAKAIETALAATIAAGKNIILIFGYDVAKRLGITIRDSTSIKSNILVLDELLLEAGDWIDIGSPLKDTESFPVTVKSLVFNENKEYS